MLTNRVVKDHRAVTARTLPIHARDDGLDG